MPGTRKLGRTSDSRAAMLRAMVTFLLENGKIETTVTRAKEVRILVDKLITLGKAGTPHARRLAAARMKINTEAGKLQSKKMVLDKLFSDLAQRFATRNGGYTRIIRIGHRIGDAAEACLIQLVEAAPAAEEAKAE